MTFQSGKITRILHELWLSLGIITGIALYDAVIGGWIETVLWPNILSQQLIMDGYQAGLSITIGLFLFLYIYKLNPRVCWASLMLLVGYVEDTIYFLLLNISKYITYVISSGRVMPESGFPDGISGWLGWIWRSFGMTFTKFPIEAVIGINLIFITITYIMLWTSTKD